MAICNPEVTFIFSSCASLMAGQKGTKSDEMQRHANSSFSNTNPLLLHNFERSYCTLKPCSSNVSFVAELAILAVKLAIIICHGEEGYTIL